MTDKTRVRLKNDHYKISPTAVLCARVRAQYTDMHYAQEIYDEVLKDKHTANDGMLSPVLRSFAMRMPSVRAKLSVLEGRYVSTNNAIERFGLCSILELACGLSPRGLEFSEMESPRKDLVYVETDLDEMLEIKKGIVSQIRANKGQPYPQNHYLAPIDALKYNDLKTAGDICVSFGNDKPIAIIHEGLLFYLSRDEQIQLRNNIRDFLKQYSPNGAWITPDMAGLSKHKSDRGIVGILIRSVEKKTGRSLNYFQSQQEVESFLGDGGLKSELLPNEHLVERLSCIRKARINPQKVRDIAPTYRARIITLV